MFGFGLGKYCCVFCFFEFGDVFVYYDYIVVVVMKMVYCGNELVLFIWVVIGVFMGKFFDFVGNYLVNVGSYCLYIVWEGSWVGFVDIEIVGVNEVI